MTLKHKKTSSAGPSADPAKVGGNDWNDDHVVDVGGLTLPGRTDAPAAPPAGSAVLFAKLAAGVALPAFRNATGAEQVLQAALSTNAITWIFPMFYTTGLFQMNTSYTSSGTMVSRSPTYGAPLWELRRVGISIGANLPSNASRIATSAWFTARTASRTMRAVLSWMPSDPAPITTGGASSFYGLSNSVPGGAPSNNFNLVGVGADADEQTYSFFVNDGTGQATKIALGSGFPATGNQVEGYQLTIVYTGPAAEMKLELLRMTTGEVASVTFTTDLPTLNTGLQLTMMRANGSSNLASGFDFCGFYCEEY